MRRRRGSSHERAVVALIVGLVPIGLGGCFNAFDPRIAPTRGVSEPPPVPNTPQNLLRLFEWCWNHRSVDEYREIFTDDYQFVFALTDSAGNAFRDRALTREEELDT